MPARPHPSLADLRFWAEQTGQVLDDDALQDLQRIVDPLADSIARLDELAAATGVLRATEGRSAAAPVPGENPFGAWRWRCAVGGMGEGSLAGKAIAVKDTIAVAGVPLSAGSALLDGYVPAQDATAVSRILEASGRIVGTTVCENLALSANSHTSDHGAARNPHNFLRSTGGSSNGSAAVVATGEVDAALGGDQGGSVRIPASWTGVVGLKPTFGLVPCTGTFPFESTVDHLGILARTVADVAAVLDVIAGPDGLDPRATVPVADGGYLAGLANGVAGLRIGVVTEGFGWETSDPRVDDAVRAAADVLAQAGCTVENVSIPLHREGPAIAAGVSVQGFAHTVFGRRAGWHHVGLLGLSDRLHEAVDRNASALPDTVTRYLALAHHLDRTAGERYYQLGRLLGRELTRAYDAVFHSYDLLCMPTTPTLAQPVPTDGTDRLTGITQASQPILNTCAFNVTGHPAVSVPCGDIDGLPVGLMLVAVKGADGLTLRAAQAIATALPPRSSAGRVRRDVRSPTHQSANPSIR
ncbi:amidase family protein [Georgenia sp.]